mmetsp:Transcript_55972/g.102657  ORF Transcript_55972/g.102657 Transcript_55972/m.102657 type:complete len:99 (+) Transcript_55972:2-298(+)
MNLKDDVYLHCSPEREIAARHAASHRGGNLFEISCGQEGDAVHGSNRGVAYQTMQAHEGYLEERDPLSLSTFDRDHSGSTVWTDSFSLAGDTEANQRL